MMIQIESCDYSNAAPGGYVCGDCGASGVKLWRKYQTFLENQSLRCVNCACENQKRAFPGKYGGDQIGWLVPAVPTEDGETFWGYTSVPQAGVEWWKRLPLVNKEPRP